MPQMQQQSVHVQHVLTVREALQGIWFPLVLTVNFGLGAVLPGKLTPMVGMNAMLALVFLSQTLRAFRNYLCVRRGETVLVLAPPPSPLIMLWSFGALIGTALGVIVLLCAVLTFFMAVSGTAAWYLPPALLAAGIVLAFFAHTSWRRLREVQHLSFLSPPTEPVSSALSPTPTGRWWTRSDVRD